MVIKKDKQLERQRGKERMIKRLHKLQQDEGIKFHKSYDTLLREKIRINSDYRYYTNYLKQYESKEE